MFSLLLFALFISYLITKTYPCFAKGDTLGPVLGLPLWSKGVTYNEFSCLVLLVRYNNTATGRVE